MTTVNVTASLQPLKSTGFYAIPNETIGTNLQVKKSTGFFIPPNGGTGSSVSVTAKKLTIPGGNTPQIGVRRDSQSTVDKMYIRTKRTF
jgi:hypothetical protein